MRRTAFATGIIIPALLAVLPGCEDPFVCHGFLIPCGSVCIDPATDNQNCGACGAPCSGGTHCADNQCTADVACTAPAVACGSECVDTQTSVTHCGDCATACGPLADCVGGACAAPLVAMQTSLMDRTVARDLFVLRDVTFELTQIGATSFATDRVIDHAVLPDGSLLLVAAQTEGVFELFRASPRGGGLTRVSGTLVAGGDVLPGIVVSRDGKKVLYRADQDVDDEIDLYAVSLATPGASVKVDGALATGGEVSRVFALSADGRRAAYVAHEDSATQYEAYTVDLSGATAGPAQKLNPVVSGDVWDLQLTGDGQRVVYRAYDPGIGRLALHVVDTASPGVETEVTYADGGEGHVEGYRITPDDAAVVFTGSNVTYDESLWRAPLASPADAVRLADGTTQTWVRPDLVVTHDGSRVYFRKVSGAFGFDRLFRVDVATPGAVTQLSPVGDTSAEEVTDFVVSDDERTIVYRGGADGAEGGNPTPGTTPPDTFERVAPAIYHIDLTATAPPAPTTLSPAPVVGHEGIGPGYVVTRDGRRVVYRADDDQSGFSDAYLSVLDTAGTVRKVSPPLDQTSDSTDVSILTRF